MTETTTTDTISSAKNQADNISSLAWFYIMMSAGAAIKF